MICEVCGSNIPDSAKFCPHCGEVLNTKEGVPIGPSSIDSSSEHDFKIPLEQGVEIPVVPTKFNYSENPLARPSRRASNTSNTGENAKAALVLFGFIGAILLIVGLVIMFGTGTSGSSFLIGITITIIGIIFFALIIGIASKGECCECCWY